MKQIKAKILENKKAAQGFYKMRVESAYLAKSAKPGQFLEVKCSDANDLLLRRPLGVHRILKNSIEILYEVIGKGTELLSGKKAGGYLDIIGPLGNGFTIRPKTKDHRPQTTILVAGGIGVAPLLALAEKLVESLEFRVQRKKIFILIGACKKEHILCANDFKKLGCKVIISTEDGSLGKRGLITEQLNFLLSTINYELSTIYACGPTAMLKAVAKIAEARQIECQVSLDERMACGVGVCLGCPVRIKSPESSSQGTAYKMVCKDGPVFNAKEIAWLI